MRGSKSAFQGVCAPFHYYDAGDSREGAPLILAGLPKGGPIGLILAGNF